MMVGAAVAAFVAQPVQAQDARPRGFDIPPQDATQALNSWSKQTGIQLLFPFDGLQGRRTAAIRGRFTPRAALLRLLDGLPLQIATETGSTVALRKREPTTKVVAQQPEAPAEAPQDDIVVTGTNTRLTQFRAPYSISTYRREDIDQQSPLSTADLIGSLPGFYAEATSGEVSATVYTRGLPLGGYRFVQLLEDGLPIFNENQEGTILPDVFVRDDLMTERVEAVRLGTSPILYNNAPGGVINFITRKGTDRFKGAIRVTAQDNDAQRIDGYVSGPIADRLTFATGGFYRIGDGLRRTGFTADKGGQLRANVTYRDDRGELTVYAKYQNDRNIFYLPIPLDDPRDPSSSLKGLIDPLRGTLASTNVQFPRLRMVDGTASGTTMTRDLSDGRHPDVFTAGADATFEIGGFTFRNLFRVTDGTLSGDSLFSTTAVQDATTYRNAALTRARAAFGTGVAAIRYTYADTQQNFDPATTRNLVVQAQYQSADTKFNNVFDSVSARRTVETGFGSHALSVGGYFSRYDLDQTQYAADMLFEVRNRPRLLDLVAVDAAGNTVGMVTDHGVVRYGASTFVGGGVDSTALAFYVADTWRLGKLQIDGGFRHQSTRQSGYGINTVTQNLGTRETLADDAVIGSAETRTNRSERFGGNSYTVGGLYEFADNFVMFARYTRGLLTPALSNITRGTVVTNSYVDQKEIGARYRNGFLSASVTAFTNSFDNLSVTTAVVDPKTNLVRNFVLIGKSDTPGFEGELTLNPTAFFSLTGNLTYQEPKQVNLREQGSTQPFAFKVGRSVARIPKLIFNVTPAVKFDVAGNATRLYLNAAHVGRRFVDAANTTLLPAYTELQAGLIVERGPVRAQLNVSNLTNTFGLSEGNPRQDTLTGQGTPDAIYGRPLFGRLVKLSLQYSL
jgi:outer membrane receptor protein involved in Fe transport